jgi:hypothetical protein
MRTSQPASSSWSWTKRAPVIELDRCEYGTLFGAEAVDEVSEPVTIGRARSGTDPLAVGEQRVPVETFAAEVESDVQHGGASF